MASGDGAVADVWRKAEVFSCAVFTIYDKTEGDCPSLYNVGLEEEMRLKGLMSYLEPLGSPTASEVVKLLDSSLTPTLSPLK
jgi:hypothetical protein